MHRMLLYAWLEQDETANKRMRDRIWHYPLFGFLDRYVRRRQAEGVFGPNTVALVVPMLLAGAISHGVNSKLYGLGSEHSDEQVAATYARLLLDGLRGGLRKTDQHHDR